MNTAKRIFTLVGSCMLLSGCGSTKPEQEDKAHEIIPGISLGMKKEEVFEIFGDNYIYTEDHRNYGYKNNVEYGYSIDKVDVFGVDIKTQMFFEFENNDKLVCYGYHIGRTGDYYDSVYPYSKSELTEAYDKIFEDLTEWYGSQSTGLEASYNIGILNENSWENEYGSIWFIVGVNMWSDTSPVSYEKGVNEIVLSCSVTP